LNLINKIERGAITDPHYSTLNSVAGALDMSLSDLLLEEPALSGKAEALEEAGPLSPEWAHRADPDIFRLRIRESASEELIELGEALVADFYRVRTREELVEDGPAPDVQRVRAFSLASVVNEELVRRGEKSLQAYILAFRRFENAIAGEVGEAPSQEDREHQAG